MATDTDRRLLCAIVDYLHRFVDDEQTRANKKESIQVAIQILRSVFDLPPPDLNSQGGSSSLFTIFQQAIQSENPVDDSEAASKAEALKNEGNDLMSFGRYEEAVQKYTEALALVRSPIYYCNRAAAYSKLNKHQEALNDCRAALVMNPNYNKAYGRMGLAYYNLENYEEAVKTYRKAYELDPNNETFLCNMRLAEGKLNEMRASSGQDQTSNGQPDAGTRSAWPTLASMINSPAFVRTVQTLSQMPAIQTMLETLSRDFEANGNNNAGLPEVINMVERMARSFDFNAELLANMTGGSIPNNNNNNANENVNSEGGTNNNSDNRKPPDGDDKKQD